MTDNKYLEEISKKCLEESKRSFRILSEQKGLPIERLIQDIQEIWDWTAFNQSFNFGDPKKNYEAYYDSIRQMNFWDRLASRQSEINKSVLEALFYVIDDNNYNDFFNEKYILSIAEKFNIFPKDYNSKNDFLKSFAQSVPHIHLYDFEYNAFVKRKSLIHGFPAIVFHHMIFGVLQNLAGFFIPTLFKANNKEDGFITEVPYKDIIEKSHDNLTHLFLAVNIPSLLDKFELSFTNADIGKGYFVTTNFVIDCIQKFILLHEYGHFYGGHLDSLNTDKNLEYIADRFASFSLYTYILIKSIGISEMGLAITIIFISSHIRDVYFKMEESTHPLAIKRFMALVNQINQKEVRKQFFEYWNNIALLLNPFLLEKYNISILYLHERSNK